MSYQEITRNESEQQNACKRYASETKMKQNDYAKVRK